MPDLEPAVGGIALAEENLRLHLANCPRFRSWANAGTVQQAINRIHIDALPSPADDKANYSKEEMLALRPFALLATIPKEGYSRVRVATETYIEIGELGIALEQNVPDDLAQAHANVERIFKNHLGVIINELLGLAYQGGFLAIDAITLHGPFRADPEVVQGEGDFQFAALQIKYGVGQR